MIFTNSRSLITNTTGRYGNKSALKLLMFNHNQKNNCLLLRQISQTSNVSNNKPATESAPSQPAPASPPPPKKSSSFKIVALALTGFTVGLGFAYLNPDSRKQLQQAVPQINQVFDMIDDLTQRLKKQVPSLPSIPSFPPSQVKTEPKPAEKISPIYEAPKQAAPASPPEPKPQPTPVVVEKPKATPEPSPPVVTTPPAPVVASSPAQTEKKPEKQPEKPVDSPPVAAPELDLDWKKTLRRHELQEEATIDAIETKLNTHVKILNEKIADAIASASVSVENLNKYGQTLRTALDESQNEVSKDVQWQEVTDLFHKQAASVNETKLKMQLANKSIEELENLLNEVKLSGLNENVKNLRQTQTDLIEQCRKLQAEKTRLAEAIIHANVLRTYTNEQKSARNQFLKEMQALQPDGIQISNRPEDQLTTEEINNLLIHAHKRVLQLQKQIEKIQMAQSQQIQEALEEQRKQNAELQKENETNLYKLAKKEFELEKEKIVENERQKSVEDIKRELSRQAAAHQNHLAKMLKMQQDELASFYANKLAVENEKTRQEFYSRVADSLGRIKGIEKALNARANLELQANNAKQLWLAIQSLTELIQNPSSTELVSIKTNIETIKDSAPDNEFIQRIVSTVPSNAMQTGVWTEPDLKERFQNLKKICSRVALIDERGGSLFKYFISYLQSFFIMHAKVDTSSLENLNLNSTFSILDHAEQLIENGNLESAVRLMQQLKGEPYRLARDWIRDAILLLEIKQACELLTAYISSIYISSRSRS